jgi:hypothetical protein
LLEFPPNKNISFGETYIVNPLTGGIKLLIVYYKFLIPKYLGGLKRIGNYSKKCHIFQYAC